MNHLEKQPEISIGILENTEKIRFHLSGQYDFNGSYLPAGQYEARPENNLLQIQNCQGRKIAALSEINLIPEKPDICFITVCDIPIGKHFHWHRMQEHSFKGTLQLKSLQPGTVTLINKIPLEWYLESVICSEMSSTSPVEFLKAHSVISRSWTLAQINKKKAAGSTNPENTSWTDANLHKHFDLCSDDHCQRYHGTRSINPELQKIIQETFGRVLTCEEKICDTRFSKCCGGITEQFSTCWQDHDFDYLQPVMDLKGSGTDSLQQITDEVSAKKFILSKPDAFCNIENKPDILNLILPGFDQETENFFRWEFSVTKQDLRKIISEKTGTDFGEIQKITPLARGASGRIYRLKISGTRNERIFGKELEIRRILSPTHLYSSAFVTQNTGDGFMFSGAGWGHGVGLCQIGAAHMAIRGYDYKQILEHYFRGAHVETIY